MKVVYIPNPSRNLIRQTKNSSGIWGNYKFIFSNEQPYDYIVVLDDLQASIECKVDKAHRLVFLGEPPYIKVYNKKYLNQFGHIFGCSKTIHLPGYSISHPNLPWMIGENLKENSHQIIGDSYMTYDDFKNDSLIEKSRMNKLCIITSNKRFTRGHKRRVDFVEKLMKEEPSIIDVYGNGYNSIPDKFDILKKYKYTLVIENCQYPNYWTEKLGDSYLAGCYPIYCGCPNIEDYFDCNSYTKISISNFNLSVETIKKTISDNIYTQAIEFIKKSKEQVLDQYNIFAVIASVLDGIKIDNTCNRVQSILHPQEYSLLERIKLSIAQRYDIVL